MKRLIKIFLHACSIVFIFKFIMVDHAQHCQAVLLLTFEICTLVKFKADVLPSLINLWSCFKPVWGVRFEKPSQWAIVLKYFQYFKEKQWPSTFVTFAPRLRLVGSTIAIIMPICHASTYGQVLAPGQTWAWLKGLQNSGSRILCYGLKSCQCKIITEKKL